MSEDAWLSTTDDTQVVVAKLTPEERDRLDYLEARRRMPRGHRDLLDALAESGFNSNMAYTAMRRKGYAFVNATFSRWRNAPLLRRAIEIVEKQAVVTAGISASKTLISTQALADYGSETVPMRDRHGKVVVDPETGEPVMILRDPSLALKSNELLGKSQRLWGNEQAAVRVTLNLVDLTGTPESPSILGEATEVE